MYDILRCLARLLCRLVVSGQQLWSRFQQATITKTCDRARSIAIEYPYSDTYMNMLCNTTSCGHFKHSCPWALAPVKPPFCRGKFWQCTQTLGVKSSEI